MTTTPKRVHYDFDGRRDCTLSCGVERVSEAGTPALVSAYTKDVTCGHCRRIHSIRA